MSGIPLANFPALRKAKKNLEVLGYDVVTPVEHNEMMGLDETVANDKYDKKTAILWDLEQVANSDCIFMLPGFSASPGCRVEIALAKFMCIPVYGLLTLAKGVDWYLV